MLRPTPWTTDQFQPGVSVSKPQHLTGPIKVERPQNEAVATSNVLILAGPGGTAFGQEEVTQLGDNLQAKGKGDVASLGDGAASVTLQDLRAELRQLKEKGGPVTIFVEAHGKVDGEHCIELGDGTRVPTREFFQAVKEELGEEAPISIFMTSRHGGEAMEDAVKELPKNAVFVALAPGDALAHADVNRLSAALAEIPSDLDGDNWTESDELLLLYLTKALKTRIGPELAVGGQGHRVLDSDLQGRIGQPFSAEEKERIHEKLDGLLGRTATKGIIHSSETAQSQWEIPAIHYGAALAAVLVADY